MLKRRIAVGDQIDVHPEQRSALGHHQHVLGPRRGNNLLTLFAARLVVVLHRYAALILDPADMGQRVLVAVDPGVDAGRFGAVDDLAGREDPRREQRASALALRSREDRTGAGRWVVDRPHAHRQFLHCRPILLRHQIAHPLRAMGMRIDEPGHDGFAGGVDHRGARGHLGA